MKDETHARVFQGFRDVTMPCPTLGSDSENEAEFINLALFRWCERNKLTMTRSRSGNKNHGADLSRKTGKSCGKRLDTTFTTSPVWSMPPSGRTWGRPKRESSRRTIEPKLGQRRL